MIIDPVERNVQIKKERNIRINKKISLCKSKDGAVEFNDFTSEQQIKFHEKLLELDKRRSAAEEELKKYKNDGKNFWTKTTHL